jgi:hypothetical protein
LLPVHHISQATTNRSCKKQERQQAESDPHQMLLQQLILLGLQFDQPLQLRIHGSAPIARGWAFILPLMEKLLPAGGFGPTDM